MFRISISVNPVTGEIDVSLTEGRSEYHKRTRNKGKSLLAFPEKYVVIDIETTGLDPEYCEIIEFAGIKYIGSQEVDSFQSLIKPQEEVDGFITGLTGITNEMLDKAPTPEEVLPAILDFIGDDILIAHNAHFDINFLYDYFEQYLNAALNNDFVCTMRLSRRVFPKLENHKLKTLCENLDIHLPTHRSFQDAVAAHGVFLSCKQAIESRMTLTDFTKQMKRKYSGFKASEIAATVDYFDFKHPLFGRQCVFTGILSRMDRKEAIQLVVNLGGKCSDNVNRTTDYLIMGVQDYSRFTDGQKSNKTKKAEALILKGQELEIISENVFYELVLQEIGEVF